MEKENITLQTEILILVHFIKEWGKAKGYINGKMKVAMKVNGTKTKCMGLVPMLERMAV
jgi:hypothetical protein